MPLVGQFMAADRTLYELETELVAAYTPILRRPEVEVVLRQAGPLKVWVDGEVRQPGVYAYVNHNLIEAALLGATATFTVAGEWDNDLMTQVSAPAPIPA